MCKRQRKAMNRSLARLASKPKLRVAGLMSGTSADGVDVAIVEITSRTVNLLAFETIGYPAGLRRRIFELFEPTKARIENISHLNFVIGEVFAAALIEVARRADISLDSIDLVGSHGQTIYHAPQPRRLGGIRTGSTLQIGEPSVIAQRTGITTVADFRPRDIAAGGQGAPLVPYADYLLFRHQRIRRAVQNIGGVANVTFLPAGCSLDQVIAFDTGPGNLLIDAMAGLVSAGRRRYDQGGKMAASGAVNKALLSKMLRHAFFRRRPPKTTGREQFGARYAQRLYGEARKARLSPNDLLATVTALTACSIADAYRRFLPRMPDQVILCGGGARNPTLVAMLRRELAAVDVLIMDELGLDADAKEAVSFALLARETIRQTANNVPAATGANQPVVLGKIVPGQAKGDHSPTQKPGRDY